jgi:hypothetical protein
VGLPSGFDVSSLTNNILADCFSGVDDVTPREAKEAIVAGFVDIVRQYRDGVEAGKTVASIGKRVSEYYVDVLQRMADGTLGPSDVKDVCHEVAKDVKALLEATEITHNHFLRLKAVVDNVRIFSPQNHLFWHAHLLHFKAGVTAASVATEAVVGAQRKTIPWRERLTKGLSVTRVTAHLPARVFSTLIIASVSAIGSAIDFVVGIAVVNSG